MAAPGTTQTKTASHCHYCHVVCKDKPHAEKMDVKSHKHQPQYVNCPTKWWPTFRKLVDFNRIGLFRLDVPLPEKNETDAAYARRVETMITSAGIPMDLQISAVLKAAQTNTNAGGNLLDITSGFIKSPNQPSGTQSGTQSGLQSGLQSGPQSGLQSGPQSGPQLSQLAQADNSTSTASFGSFLGCTASFFAAFFTLFKSPAGLFGNLPFKPMSGPRREVKKLQELKPEQINGNFWDPRIEGRIEFFATEWLTMMLKALAIASVANLPYLVAQYTGGAHSFAHVLGSIIEQASNAADSWSFLSGSNDAATSARKKTILDGLTNVFSSNNENAAATGDSKNDVSISTITQFLNHQPSFDFEQGQNFVIHVLFSVINLPMWSAAVILGIGICLYFLFFCNVRRLQEAALIVCAFGLLGDYCQTYMDNVMICAENGKQYYAWVPVWHQATVFKQTTQVVPEGSFDDNKLSLMSFSLSMEATGNSEFNSQNCQTQGFLDQTCASDTGTCTQPAVNKEEYIQMRDNLVKLHDELDTKSSQKPGGNKVDDIEIAVDHKIENHHELVPTEAQVCKLLKGIRWQETARCVFGYTNEEVADTCAELPCDDIKGLEHRHRCTSMNEDCLKKKMKRQSTDVILRVNGLQKAKSWYDSTCGPLQDAKHAAGSGQAQKIDENAPPQKLMDAYPNGGSRSLLFRVLYPRHDVILEAVEKYASATNGQHRVCRGNHNRRAYSDTYRYYQSENMDLTANIMTYTYVVKLILFGGLWAIGTVVFFQIWDIIQQDADSFFFVIASNFLLAAVFFTNFILPFMKKVQEMDENETPPSGS